MWASKQAAALTESPPNLVQQDQQNAENLTGVARTFPTPVRVPAPAGKVRST